jgi:hypothetical protein
MLRPFLAGRGGEGALPPPTTEGARMASMASTGKDTSVAERPFGGARAMAFFVLAFALSWAFWIPFAVFAPPASRVLSGGGGSPVLLLQLLGNFGPSAAAIALLALSGLRRRPP